MKLTYFNKDYLFTHEFRTRCICILFRVEGKMINLKNNLGYQYILLYNNFALNRQKGKEDFVWDEGI